jgi:Tol biopolymer transport system component
MTRLGVFFLAVVLALPWAGAEPQPESPRLLIAFASVRERRDPPYPKIYFYEHDGVATGKLLGAIESVGTEVNKSRADMHPSLSRDGRYCAFASQLGIQDGGRIEVWDRQEKKLLAFPAINDLTNIHQMAPSLTADGKLVAFTAWARPEVSNRWGVLLYDLAAKKFVDLPNLNGPMSDQRMPAFSGDGKFLAFASNMKGGVGLNDVYLYDLATKLVVSLPEMNSKSMDVQPSLSGDGRLVAFSSDRTGGAGGRDIYLYDRTEKKFLPLPGLNSPFHEQSPALSDDGRYLAFVSERLDGAGERDVYLYDRQTQKLLPTPGLNSKEDDFDPCVIVLPGRQRPSRSA